LLFLGDRKEVITTPHQDGSLLQNWRFVANNLANTLTPPWKIVPSRIQPYGATLSLTVVTDDHNQVDALFVPEPAPPGIDIVRSHRFMCNFG
jgi:hypothetical protein